MLQQNGEERWEAEARRGPGAQTAGSLHTVVSLLPGASLN